MQEPASSCPGCFCMCAGQGCLPWVLEGVLLLKQQRVIEKISIEVGFSIFLLLNLKLDT